MPKTTTLEDIDARMRQVAFLLAQQTLVSSLKDAKQREKIAFLNQAGLSYEDIAVLLGTNARVVTVELSAIRTAAKKTDGKKAKR